MLGELRKAGLTANPAKCRLGLEETAYLGYQVLVTDHAPLKWMAGAKDTNARVTRWFLALQDFRFRVDHRPGREHANADALSRRDTCLGGFQVDLRPEPRPRHIDTGAPHFTK